MREEAQCDEMKGLIEEVDIDVMVIVEHWRGKKKRVRKGLEVKESLEEVLGGRQILGSEYRWEECVRENGKGGGVGIAVKKTLGRVERLEEYEDDGLLWLKLCVGGIDLFVAAVYLVPRTSDWYEGNLERKVRLIRGIQCYRQKGRVVVMGDMNARIGSLDVNIERECGEGVVSLYRESEDEKVTQDGRDLLEMMAAANMVVMNGLEGKMKEMTCHKGRGSVVDWVVVERGWMREWVDMWVDDRGWMGTDHNLMMGVWRCEGCVERKEEKRTREKERIEKIDRIGRQAWRVDVWRGRKNKWAKWREQCAKKMRKWVEERVSKEGESVEELWKSWFSEYRRVVNSSVGWNRGKKRQKKRQNRWDRQVSVMKKVIKSLSRDIAKAEVGRREWLIQKRIGVRREMRQRVRKLRRMIEWKRMREIEDIGRTGDKKKMLDRLKSRLGSSKGQGGERERMRDGEEWVEGEELRKRWRWEYERIGKRLLECEGYDDVWKKSVDVEISRIEEEEGEEDNVLNKEIKEEEVRLVVRD